MGRSATRLDTLSGLSLSLAGQGGGGGEVSPIAALFADGADGLDLDFSALDRLYQDSAATTPVTTTGESIGHARDAHSATVFNNATQGTAGARATYQATGAKFDGSADFLATAYSPQAGANCLVALVTFPASAGSRQLFAGSVGTDRFFIGTEATTGLLIGGVGSVTPSTMTGGSSVFGQTIVVGLSCDGSTVRLFCDDEEVYSGAQGGGLPTAVPLYVGAINQAGATTFSAAAVKRLIVARQALALADYLEIRSAITA